MGDDVKHLKPVKKHGQKSVLLFLCHPRWKPRPCRKEHADVYVLYCYGVLLNIAIYKDILWIIVWRIGYGKMKYI